MKIWYDKEARDEAAGFLGGVSSSTRNVRGAARSLTELGYSVQLGGGRAEVSGRLLLNILAIQRYLVDAAAQRGKNRRRSWTVARDLFAALDNDLRAASEGRKR